MTLVLGYKFGVFHTKITKSNMSSAANTSTTTSSFSMKIKNFFGDIFHVMKTTYAVQARARSIVPLEDTRQIQARAENGASKQRGDNGVIIVKTQEQI
jgi:hypothetical protein